MRKINFIVLLSILLLFSLFGCTSTNTTEFSVEEIKKLAELRTLECSFNNVSDVEKSSIFGYAKYFVQYEAKVIIGIDMKEVEYDENKRVLYIPKAKVFDVKIITDSIDEKNKNAIFNSIDQREKNRIIEESRNELKNSIIENKYLLDKGQQIAENLLRNQIELLYTIAGKKPNITYAYK